MHIAIIFINIGSYHLARLEAAYKVCQELKWQFTAIQVTDDTLDHSWGEIISKSIIPIHTLLSVNSKQYDTRKDTFSPIADKALEKYLDRIKPNVVFLPGWYFSITTTGLKWCRINQSYAIVMSATKEDDASRVWWRELYKRWKLKQYEAAIVGGKPQQRYLEKLGMPSNSIFTGYNVVGNDNFHPNKIRSLPPPHQQPFFLAINRFVHKKNIPRLIVAYAEYRKSASNELWDLILCGDGKLRCQIEQQITELGLEKYIYLPGFLQQNELLPYFAHASCFIHASTQEQWGLVVNEAMAAGLPVLVSNRCGCFEDLIIEGVNGFGFDPEDIQQLTNLMLKVSSGNLDLEQIGQAALNHIQKFSPDYFSRGLEQAVKYVLKNYK